MRKLPRATAKLLQDPQGMRALAVVLAVLGLILIGNWVIGQRYEKIRLTSRVARLESRATAPQGETRLRQTQIQNERRRLEQLRTTLNEVVRLGPQPPTGSVNAHIGNLTQRAAELENQIADLHRERMTVNLNASEYSQAQESRLIDSELSLADQVQSIDAEMQTLSNRMAALETQARTPEIENQLIPLRAEAERLRSERGRLVAQLETFDALQESAELAATQQVDADQNEITSQQSALREELASIRQDLAYWQQMQAPRAPAASQPEKVQQLREMIQAQENRLNELEKSR